MNADLDAGVDLERSQMRETAAEKPLHAEWELALLYMPFGKLGGQK